MVRVVTQSIKNVPTMPVVEIIRGGGLGSYSAMSIASINPTDTYSDVLNLYSIDGVIENYYFASAMIFSNDTAATKTGLESKFPTIYTIAGTSITVKYVYLTRLEIYHSFGRTDFLVPGYQTSITYTSDGTTTATKTPNTISYNSNTYYPVNCTKLCYDDGAANNYLFKVFPNTLLANYAASNSSVYTNIDLGAVGRKFAFDLTMYPFINQDTVAYVATNGSLILTGQEGYNLEVIGVDTIEDLTSSMILTSN